jgi:hypothetical protein
VADKVERSMQFHLMTYLCLVFITGPSDFIISSFDLKMDVPGKIHLQCFNIKALMIF